MSSHDDESQEDSARQFRRILSISKDKRTSGDLDIIYGHLREIQAISKMSESVIRQMAKLALYEVHESNEPTNLYYAGDTATCCFILLTGSVYLDGHLKLAGSCFGQQTDSGKRISDCLLLEDSEMIVITYPPSNQIAGQTSCHSPLDDIDWDFPGMRMKENVILESDEDDDISKSGVVQDIVRDCLEKDPTERTEIDIHILMDFIQQQPAFSKLTNDIKVEMCKVMVLAVIDIAGGTVYDHEEIDSWFVILSGSVEILVKNKPVKVLIQGDSFGVNTTPGIMYHEGVMKTRVDDCQFVCIAKEEYWRIFSQQEASCANVEETIRVDMLTGHIP